METWLLYPLIVIAVGTGWWLGRRDRKSPEAVPANYYQGLNYLLNEEPDRAVSTFIDDLDVNKETLETHLALGALLRRRGELEKALSVHENILNRATLDQETLQKVQLELARDYLLAGLLDRAEELSVKLGESSAVVRRESLKITLEVYEREREWAQAVEVAQLLANGEEAMKYERAISHYFCELAEESLEKQDLVSARKAVSEAIGHDSRNPRASLIHGQIDLKEDKFEDAIVTLERIQDQDSVYVPESLEALEQAYRESSQSFETFRGYLQRCLEDTPSISIVLMIAKNLRETEGDEAVAKFIANHLKQNPTIRGLTQLIDLHIDNTSGIAKENLFILRSFAEALVADKPAYRCETCGFDGKRMRWHCPSCKDWASIKPIFGLEGE